MPKALGQTVANDGAPIRILIVSGERSGDLHGAELAAALRGELRQPEIFGCGGEAMRAAGVELVADLRDFAMVGITEVVTGLPRARRAFRRILAEAERRRPALAVLIDAPSLNLRLAKKLKPRGVKICYYVSPQIWAWKRWRLKHLQSRVDKMLCLFEFETEIYKRAGIPVECVGHPLVDRTEIVGPGLARSELRARAGFDPKADPDLPIVALLPGSREIEVRYNLPEMVAAAREIRRRRRAAPVQFVLPVAATLDRLWVEARLEGCGAQPGLVRTVMGATHDVLRHAEAAIVASGTATLEAALIGIPMVVVYKVAPSTAFFARYMVKVPFYSLVNLLAGKPVVKELIQKDFTAHAVAAEVDRLLDDETARRKMTSEYQALRAHLGAGGAARRAARAVAAMLQPPKPKGPLPVFKLL